VVTPRYSVLLSLFLKEVLIVAIGWAVRLAVTLATLHRFTSGHAVACDFPFDLVLILVSIVKLTIVEVRTGRVANTIFTRQTLADSFRVLFLLQPVDLV